MKSCYQSQMFIYATGSSLKQLMDGSVAAARYDEWLESWMCAAVGREIDALRPRRTLDLDWGSGLRSYRERNHSSENSLRTIPIEDLPSMPRNEFDLVIAASFQREECFSPPDPANAFSVIENLAGAARLVAPGGRLVYSYLYPFFDDQTSTLFQILEPAAIYRSLLLRGLQTVGDQLPTANRIHAYHDPDTLFVHQRVVVPFFGRHLRVARVFATLQRPDHRPPNPASHRSWKFWQRLSQD